MTPLARLLTLTILTALAAGSSKLSAEQFQSEWPEDVTRPWLGAAYWSNPLQDWRIHEGRLECLSTAANRNVHVLTHRLGEAKKPFTVSVRLGVIEGGRGTAGFRLGIRGPLDDYRNALIFGSGLDTGVTADGAVFIGDPPRFRETTIDDPIDLTLTAQPDGERFHLKLTAKTGDGERTIGEVEQTVPAARLVGNVALVSNFTGQARGRRPGPAQRQNARFWFSDWKLGGEKVTAHPDDAFGPILFAMHTLNQGVMKMCAQMPPLGESDPQSVHLEIKQGDEWQRIGTEKIDPLARTATFRVEHWDDTRDVPYRLVYEPKGGEPHRYTGTVRKDPVDKESIVVAGFTGHQDYLFPNSLLAENVAKLDPDLLAFTGDQIYENNAGYGIVRAPVETAALDYLRKWYVFGWGFRDLMRDRPTLCLPDDHDVYQGNIWGQGGRDCNGIANHARGGYAMDAEWVNAIQRMQTSHHPDPYDPTPVKQGITVYYGPFVYGRIGFAVIEDRKFKSGPEGKVNTWPGRPDHLKDSKIDPKTLDKPGLKLLGDRQLKFLNDWAGDWKGQDLKIAISQTIFANVANYHGANEEYLIADLDSNGWPQTPRNNALAALRRGFVFHLAGDQHLASIVHHGIDEWRDAGFSFCVPSIAAGYPRSWRPEREGKAGMNRKPGMPPYTGDFRDGLGNLITVHAVGNPEEEQRKDPLGRGHDKASGFGIVRLHKPDQTITMECYRLLVDTADPKPEDQFPGWPKTVSILDNYGREPAAHLPTLEITGLESAPVVQVRAAAGELVYALRLNAEKFRPDGENGPTVFRPFVFDENATYTVRIGDPDRNEWKELKDLKPDAERRIEVEF